MSSDHMRQALANSLTEIIEPYVPSEPSEQTFANFLNELREARDGNDVSYSIGRVTLTARNYQGDIPYKIAYDGITRVSNTADNSRELAERFNTFQNTPYSFKNQPRRSL